MLKPGRAAAGQDTHNVEPHGVKSRVSFGEVMFRQGSNGGLLAGSHCLERATEASVVAQLDLDEDEGVGSRVQIPELCFRALLSESCVERLELART